MPLALVETGRGVPGGVAYGSEDDVALELLLEVGVGPGGRWMGPVEAINLKAIDQSVKKSNNYS